MKRRNGASDPSTRMWRLTPRTPLAQPVDEGLLWNVDVNLDDASSTTEGSAARIEARQAEAKTSAPEPRHEFGMTDFEDTVPGAYVVTPTEP